MTPEVPDQAEPACAAPPAGILRGDRFCARCGYNLAGRPVEREPHYDMLVARCPACAQVAAVQEYPPLGRWSARISMLVAALWLVFLVAVALGSLGGIAGSTIGITVETTDGYQSVIRQEYRDWLQETHPSLSRWDETRFGEFWEANGATLLADQRLQWSNVFEAEEAALLLIPAGISFGVSIFWSVVLIGRRWFSLVLVVAGIAALPIGVLLVIRALLMTMEPGSSDMVAWQHCYTGPVIAALAAMAVVFSFGLALGRPICRGVVRALLPPRFRGSLSVLWTAAGKEPPLPSMFARQRREALAARGAAP
jgi:hypothetical protein